MHRDRVLSGMQPSGRLHLGNLVGALRNWVALQESYECFYFIADWHALTTGYAQPESIRDSTKDLMINFIASGLDPDKSPVFILSMVPPHAELHLLLSVFTHLGWLERVPTYKEKIEELKDRDHSTYGFLGYPVLQTADIIIYRARYVPVGIDQVPHLELSREVARRFNFLYREVFPEPVPLLTEFPKVPGLDGRKMSESYDNAIYLSDSPEVVEQKIKTMMTDHPGETANLVVTIKNEGGADAANVTSTLMENSPYLTIGDASGNYGTVTVGATASNSADPYTVTAAAGTPIGTSVPLQIQVVSGVYCDTLDFSILIGRNMPTDTGYYYTYWSHGPYQQAPVYSWYAIDTTKTLHPETSLNFGDDQTATVTVPFTFRYYGVAYTQVAICSNGWLARREADGFIHRLHFPSFEVHPQAPLALIRFSKSGSLCGSADKARCNG